MHKQYTIIVELDFADVEARTWIVAFWIDPIGDEFPATHGKVSINDRVLEVREISGYLTALKGDDVLRAPVRQTYNWNDYMLDNTREDIEGAAAAVVLATYGAALTEAQ